MELDISRVRSNVGMEKSFDLLQTVEDIKEKNIHFLKPVHIQGKIRNEEGTLYLEGDAEIQIQRICDRCLSVYPQKLNLHIEEEFHIAQKKNDDFDFLKTYNGNRLGLDQTIQDAVLLNIQINSICREDCKGICPHCGKDLNQGPCSCDHEQLDPRMEILKTLISEE